MRRAIDRLRSSLCRGSPDQTMPILGRVLPVSQCLPVRSGMRRSEQIGCRRRDRLKPRSERQRKAEQRTMQIKLRKSSRPWKRIATLRQDQIRVLEATRPPPGSRAHRGLRPMAHICRIGLCRPNPARHEAGSSCRKPCLRPARAVVKNCDSARPKPCSSIAIRISPQPRSKSPIRSLRQRLIPMHLHMFGLECNCLLVACQRLVGPVQLFQRIAAVVEGVRHSRVGSRLLRHGSLGRHRVDSVSSARCRGYRPLPHSQA